MTWKAYVVASVVTIGTTYLVSLQPANMPGNVVPAQPREVERPLAAASDIEQQAARLQSRLRQEALYREPSRNLFRFGDRPAAAARRGAATVTATSTPEPEPPLLPPPFPIKLSGIAIDGDVRTAVLSTPSDVVLATPGTEVLGYRVETVGEESVDLVGLADGTRVSLTLPR